MNYLLNVLIFIAISRADAAVFDKFSGKQLDSVPTKEFPIKNVTERCVIEIADCVPHEGSRVDGTCNNYKHPSWGAAGGPYLRLLPPDYGNRDYLRDRPHCCQNVSKLDSHCIPISVPKDDPYLKVTDIRCLNFTRAQTFQDSGCSPEMIPLEQINVQTPLLDLSTIYGVDDDALAKVRKGENGLLVLEMRNNKYFPRDINNVTTVWSVKNKIAKKSHIKSKGMNVTKEEELKKLSNESSTISENLIEHATSKTVKSIHKTKSEDVCLQNKSNETVCYQFGFPEAGNYGLRTTAIGIFFMREHNRIAEELHKINPCWKDDRLFKVSRQINIATASHIFLYELLPLLLNSQNLASNDLITEQLAYETEYDEKTPPQVYAEFEIAMRYFHTLIDGRVKLYSDNHHYKKEFPYSETLYRQGLIEQGENFEEINRGTFLQSSAKIDDIQDPEISDNFYGDLQKAHDLSAIDIQRGRDMGLRGYNEYRKLCGLKDVKQFDELFDVMDIEKIEALRLLYESVDDIDLLAGIMSEKFIQGTFLGPVLFCIVTKQLQIFKYSDRFWYERGDQTHSFSLRQLHEIRKANMARFACDNADGIHYIQPQAFLNVKPGNSLVPCAHISGIDLSKWRDAGCSEKKYAPKATEQFTNKPMSFMFHRTDTNFSSFFDDLLFYKPSDLKSHGLIEADAK